MISYKTSKRIARANLAALYESVRWLHFKKPEKLQKAYLNSDFVISAWDDKRLVGAGRMLTDGCFNAYIADIAVCPEYRGRKIGQVIIGKLLELAGDFYNVTAVAENSAAEKFFEKCGLSDIKKACRRMAPI